MQCENKHRIQNNIGNGTDKNGGHSHQRESLAVDKVIKPCSHQCKKSSCCVDGQVSIGIRKSCITCPEQHQKLIFQKKETYSEKQGEDA